VSFFESAASNAPNPRFWRTKGDPYPSEQIPLFRQAGPIRKNLHASVRK